MLNISETLRDTDIVTTEGLTQIFISPYNGRQKKEKNRKMNLTNDKNMQIREHT